MSLALDQSHDTNHQEFFKLAGTFGVPDFVKSATFEDVNGPADKSLPPHNYGWPATKEFPVHTAAATWTSAGMLITKKADCNDTKYDFVLDRLLKAARYHGIFDEVQKLIVKASTFTPTDDLPDSDFAVVLFDENNNKLRHLALRNSLEVKAAADYLHKYRDSFSFHTRQNMAERILDKANQYGTSLGNLEDFVEKQAGYGDCPSASIAELLWNRIKLIGQIDKPNETQIELAKMAKSIMDNPGAIHTPAAMQKIASIVDSVDRAYGITYSAAVPAPEDVLFQVSRKVANKIASEHVHTISGNIYKLADFNRLDLDETRKMLGDGFVDSITTGGLYVDLEKVSDVVPTLPRGDANLLDRLLAETGIAPHAKEAAHKSGMLNRDELQKMAADYAEQVQPRQKIAEAKPEQTSHAQAIFSMVNSLKN